MNKSIIMSIMMLAGSFALANNGNGDTNNSESKSTNNQNVVTPTTEETEEKVEEALYCRVKIGDDEASCWFCNCVELAKALKETVKVKVKENNNSN